MSVATSQDRARGARGGVLPAPVEYLQSSGMCSVAVDASGWGGSCSGANFVGLWYLVSGCPGPKHERDMLPFSEIPTVQRDRVCIATRCMCTPGSIRR
ncbi:hypothetical protein C8Q73DRAFT_675639 [Cubamyces lactineus]|nr:hypothetical protein C8Q73DRAFT_675639 [Cubamyces lactineus]